MAMGQHPQIRGFSFETIAQPRADFLFDDEMF